METLLLFWLIINIEWFIGVLKAKQKDLFIYCSGYQENKKCELMSLKKTFESRWQPELLDWSLNYQWVSVTGARRHLSAGEGWWKSPENEHGAASVGTWNSHQWRFGVQLQAGGVTPNATNKGGAVEARHPRARQHNCHYGFTRWLLERWERVLWRASQSG